MAQRIKGLFILIFTLFLSLILSTEATHAASLFDKINKEKLQESEKLIQEGKDRKATFILEGVFRSDNRSIRQEAAVKLARIYRKEGKLDEALSYLKEFIDISQYEVYPSTEDSPILECGLIFNAKKEPMKALRLFDYMGKNKALGMKTVLAAEGCGDSFFLMKYYDKSVNYYRYGLNRMNTTIMRRYFTETDKVAFARITKKLKDAQRLYDIERYGEGFVLYREAERLRRRNKNYTQAIEKYKEVIKKHSETVYAEASEFYTNLCLLELGKIKEAEKGLIKFYEKLPMGLYRGEALKTVGEIALEKRFNARTAEEYFTKAILWIDKAGSLEKEISKYEVPDKAKKITAPPPSMKRNDLWGNTIWSLPEPGQLFNRRTANWYLPYQKMMVQTKRALTYFMLGKKDEAIKDIEIILKVDNRERMNFKAGMPNSYSRLKQEFEQERLFATKKELSSFKGKTKIAIMLADYYYEIEQWKEAATRYRKIDREMRQRLSLSAQAYLDFMLANTSFVLRENNERSLQHLSKFHTRYKNTPTWPRAMFTYFNIYQTMAGKDDEALTTLQAIYRRMPKTEWGKKAYYHSGEFLYGKGRLEEAAKIFKDCKERFRGTWLERGAGQYLEMIKKKI